jgi:valyl-tRNA synthetase
MREVDGHFYYLKYPVIDDAGNVIDHVTVATTRPETMLGDTAVAINPKDPRAASLRGKKIRLPIVNRVIPIIEDEYVVLPDPNSSDEKARYSSGFLKVTPAHAPVNPAGNSRCSAMRIELSRHIAVEGARKTKTSAQTHADQVLNRPPSLGRGPRRTRDPNVREPHRRTGG